MNDSEQATAPESPERIAAPAVARLRGYWAILLPLLILAAQVVIGFAVGLFGTLAGIGAVTSLELVLVIAALSAVADLIIVHVILVKHGWRWRDLGLEQTHAPAVVAAVAIGLVTCVLASQFDRAVQAPRISMFQTMSAAEFAAAIAVIGLLVPFAEEVVFRGIVFPVLQARVGTTFGAVALSALLFGAFHLYPLQILVGFLLGLPLAWLRHWSGSLFAPLALHVTHNVGVIAVAGLRII